MAGVIDYTKLDYSRWSRPQWFLYAVISILSRLLARVEVKGQEHFPKTGPLLLMTNHLHMLDAPLVFYVIPRRPVVFAADSWRKAPFLGWFLDVFGDAIWVARGQADRSALGQALTVLRSGGLLGIAPEGTRSRTGGLGQGYTGVAFLATRAPAPILPVAIFGQEKAFSYWKRLRRVPVQIRFGSLVHLPQGHIRTAQLEELTDQLMLTLASMLPPEYRGIYADRVLEPVGDGLVDQGG
jgi:1-acyl-sn-glycerol-3-phosphate acyltransferase